MRIAIYMDTSGSMSGTNGGLRDDHWDRVHPRFVDLPLRYVAFSSRGDQRVQSDWDEHDKPTLASLQPYDFGGMTYLWSLIVNEANAMIAQGLPPEEVLIYVVTDGMDNQSPGRLRGFQGIGACIDELNAMGFPAEFWIVGIKLAEYEVAAYQKFANRSGGRFFQLNEGLEGDVASMVDSNIKNRISDPDSWKKARLQIIRDHLRHNPYDSVLNLAGQDSLYALRSIIPADDEDILEIGTKADAAIKSLEWMGSRRNRRGHLWILLRKDTYDDLDDVKRDALARELTSFAGNGKVHLILVDFAPPLSGVTIGGGSGRLSDLRRWASTDIEDLIDAITDYGTSLDTDKIEIGTLERFRIENRFPLPDQPYVVLDPSDNPNIKSDNWWDGNYSDEDWNAVPGLPTGTCRPGLVVTPYLDCHRVDATYREIGRDQHLNTAKQNSMAVSNFRNCYGDRISDPPRGHVSWNPATMRPLPKPYSEKTHGDVWKMGQNCFISILEEALVHIESCFCPEEGWMNNQVVIELTELGRLIGVYDHPALKCFEEAVKQISEDIRIRYSYSKVNGLL